MLVIIAKTSPPREIPEVRTPAVRLLKQKENGVGPDLAHKFLTPKERREEDSRMMLHLTKLLIIISFMI